MFSLLNQKQTDTWISVCTLKAFGSLLKGMYGNRLELLRCMCATINNTCQYTYGILLNKLCYEIKISVEYIVKPSFKKKK